MIKRYGITFRFSAWYVIDRVTKLEKGGPFTDKKRAEILCKRLNLYEAAYPGGYRK